MEVIYADFIVGITYYTCGIKHGLSIMNLKNGELMIGALWARTVPLWMINVVADIVKLSC